MGGELKEDIPHEVRFFSNLFLRVNRLKAYVGCLLRSALLGAAREMLGCVFLGPNVLMGNSIFLVFLFLFIYLYIYFHFDVLDKREEYMRLAVSWL